MRLRGAPKDDMPTEIAATAGSEETPDTLMPGLGIVPELPGDRHDHRVLRAIRRIVRSAGMYSRKLAFEHGITSPQLVCLLRIQEKGCTTLKQLAREVHLAPSTVVGIVDRLEARGLVCRERSARDRRQVHLRITSAGDELVEKAPSPLQDSLKEALEDLPREERSTIARSLEHIADLMDIGGAGSAPPFETEMDLDSTRPPL